MSLNIFDYTPEQIVSFYEKHNARPVAGAYQETLCEKLCACGIGIIAIHEHGEFASPDFIPGLFGNYPDRAEFEDGFDKGFENLDDSSILTDPPRSAAYALGYKTGALAREKYGVVK